MRLAWLTDIHLNFLSSAEIEQFFDNVAEDDPDVIVISGDIGEASSVTGFLEWMETRFQRPIYFVLGNHDFYYGSIRGVRQEVTQIAHESEWLTWLTGGRIVPLTDDTALIGHDGWADGRSGDYDHSSILMSEYLLVEELAGLSRRGRLEKLHAFGDAAAAYFGTLLPLALTQFRRVIAVMHPPPFPDAAWHEGQRSSDEFLPHLVCTAAGQTLRAVMQQHPTHELLVLCGHTHGEGEVAILPNLTVLTGGAEYRRPEVQRVFDLKARSQTD